MGTLLGFGSGFGVIDSFLQLFLKGFLEKFSSFGKEEAFHVVESLSIGGVIGDEGAVVEQGIEFGVKKFTPGRENGGFGIHGDTSL
jgi:hypothetical protein